MAINLRQGTPAAALGNVIEVPTLSEMSHAITAFQTTENTGANVRTKVAGGTPGIQDGLKGDGGNSRERTANNVQQGHGAISLILSNLERGTFGISPDQEGMYIIVAGTLN